MQQGGGSHSHQYLVGGGGADPSHSHSHSQSQSQQHLSSSQMVVEEASPISSRPPAGTGTGSLDDFMPGSGAGGFSDMDALASAAAGDDGDRGGGGGGGGGGGNRWPRQETLALLRIRSEMDAAFRDATVKGPLWEDVSRKLAELGYKRSAKKCKEKFENVDKYYKRTKEGRAGRQDGKAYKFFTELEALHNITSAPHPPTAAAANFPGIGFSSPTPISSIRPHHPLASVSHAPLLPQSHAFTMPAAQPFSASPMGLDFSSDSSSSSPETEDDDDGSDLEGDPSNVAGSSRKRKRGSGRGGGSSRRMMEFFEGLMKQVMQKQEAMQQKFLEAIEKREQDRLIREEAWRRQEMARLAREHEIMAQERAVSASRDASIIAFLQKITGQTIQLPITPPFAPAVPPSSITQTPVPVHQPIHTATPPPQQPLRQQQQPDRPHQVVSTDVVVLAAVPEQQVRAQESGGGGGSSDAPPSSRWPKTEVLALIKLRSGLESRYQEAGPKGPLWEEISAGMQRMGYRRSSKRCKEKWENINKYFKKVKESNKKRPEDAKTCPYFHELDALYRKKVIGGSSSGSIGGSEGAAAATQQVQHPADAPAGGDDLQLSAGPPAEQGGTTGTGDQEETAGAKKPEDIVIESTGSNGHEKHGALLADKAGKHEHGLGSQPVVDEDDMMEEDEETEDDDDELDDDEEELRDERSKMAYKIEFQQSTPAGSRQNSAAGGPPNGGGNGGATTASFMAMVQ